MSEELKYKLKRLIVNSINGVNRKYLKEKQSAFFETINRLQNLSNSRSINILVSSVTAIIEKSNIMISS